MDCGDCSGQVDSGFVSADEDLRQETPIECSMVGTSVFGFSDGNNNDTVSSTMLQHHHYQQQQQQRIGSVVPGVVNGRLNVCWSQIKHVEDPELFYLQDCEGDTQLHLTILFKQIEASEWLISRAAEPSLLDARNDDGHTPLHMAVLVDEPRLVRRLVLAGASPWITDAKGNTALHMACRDGRFRCAWAILEPIDRCEMPWLAPGAPVLPNDIDLRNFKCETCLQLSVQRGDLELTRLLLRHGADVEAREWRGGMTPLHMATDSNQRAMVQLLAIEGRCCLDALTYARASAYQVALNRENTELAQQLLQLGASAEAGKWESDDSSSSGSSDCFSGSDEDEVDPVTEPLLHDLSTLTFKKPKIPVCVMATWGLGDNVDVAHEGSEM